MTSELAAEIGRSRSFYRSIRYLGALEALLCAESIYDAVHAASPATMYSGLGVVCLTAFFTGLYYWRWIPKERKRFARHRLLIRKLYAQMAIIEAAHDAHSRAS